MLVAQRHPVSFLCLIVGLASACSGSTSRNKHDSLNDTPSGSASGASTSGATTAGGSKYCDAQPILERACAGIACHGKPGEPAQNNTDLLNAPVGQTLGQSLLGKPANYNLIVDATKCPTTNPELLINPNAPAESLILKKIFGTQTCGLIMPNTTMAAKQLSDADKACFVDWVDGVITESGATVTSNAAVTTVTTVTTLTTDTSSTITSGSTTTSASAVSSSTTVGTTTTGGAEIPATFDTLKLILTMNQINCTGSDCHGGVTQRIDLRPSVDGLYERLTTTTSEVCGKLIVSPGYPDESALLQVLTTGCGNVVPNCEIGVECIPRMPIECTEGVDCIPPDYIEALRQWIANGAPAQ